MKAKTQISFAVTAKLISVSVFTTRIVQSLYFLNPKFQASSHLLWLYSPVCVGPGQKPRRPVFSRQGLYITCLQQPPYHKKNTCLPYYRRINYTYLPTAIILQKQPSVYHTYGDTTKLTFLQQPTYNNNHMFTILLGIQLYKPAYSNPLTITTTCLLYYWRYIYTYQPIAATLQ